MSIEKIDFQSLDHDAKHFTTHFNSVLQNLHDPAALGIWAYLSSLPPKWSINKTQLMRHFRIGRDKLDKVISYLKKNNLLSLERERMSDGTLGRGYILVKCGVNFKKDSVLISDQAHVQACANAQVTENQLPGKIKDNTIKNKSLDVCNLHTEKPEPGLPVTGFPTAIKEISKKEIKRNKINISCASDDARSTDENSFDRFWDIYPLKKNKVRSKKIWEKKKYSDIASLICKDVARRKTEEAQWQTPQYIPHPATYLNNELWTDDITPTSTSKTKASGNAFSDWMNNSDDNGALQKKSEVIYDGECFRI